MLIGLIFLFVLYIKVLVISKFVLLVGWYLLYMSLYEIDYMFINLGNFYNINFIYIFKWNWVSG